MRFAAIVVVFILRIITGAAFIR
ncbi:MAG: YjcZ family sporulation protein [Ectobacillus sp.]